MPPTLFAPQKRCHTIRLDSAAYLFIVFVGGCVLLLLTYSPDIKLALSSSTLGSWTRIGKHPSAPVLDTDQIVSDGADQSTTAVSFQGSMDLFAAHLPIWRQFPYNEHDVLAFVHIQKTGGKTFRQHLTYDLPSQGGLKSCSCRNSSKPRPDICECLRTDTTSTTHGRYWSFTPYMSGVGWPCGTHPDLTTLQECADPFLDGREKIHRKRRYFYLTVLREPISRYLSEFRHTRIGVNWNLAHQLTCGGKAVTRYQLPPCHRGETSKGMNFTTFLSCKENLATNRQTRMLANLTSIGCYGQLFESNKTIGRMMLASAKQNLELMPFFGFTERQAESELVFSTTFKVNFSLNFTQRDTAPRLSKNASEETPTLLTRTTISDSNLTPANMEKIRARNLLDLELYEFALQLFDTRYRFLKKLYPKKKFHHCDKSIKC